MIQVRRSADRGHFDFGWLKTYHSFSFGEYQDPQHMGYEVLRVLNEDVVAAGKGFGTHGHRDMEIVTYLISGALEHKDSMNNGSVIRPGDVQRMSAGTGVMHSEFNHSPTEACHLLQIWFLPKQKGIAPGYEQKSFDAVSKQNRLCALVTPDGREGSLSMHSNASLFASVLSKGSSISLPTGKSWIQVISGNLALGDATLAAGDGAAIEASSTETVRAIADSHFVLMHF